MARCRYCKKQFKAFNSLEKYCSTAHAFAFLATPEGVAKKKAAQEKLYRKETKKKKESIKKRGAWISDLQREFNRFIRLRDRDQDCISCGKTNAEAGERFSGGAWDAGHYRSVGSAPNLRFNEDNVHKQCKKCNNFESGKTVDYRIRLIDRIGVERVEAVERNQTPLKLTIQEIKDLIAFYRKKVRELEREEK